MEIAPKHLKPYLIVFGRFGEVAASLLLLILYNFLIHFVKEIDSEGFTMNDKTRNEFATYGLEILKRSVLLVLYEGTDIVYEKSPYTQYTQGRVLTAGAIRERLDIPQPQRMSASTNALIHGILDYLYHEGHAYHYVGVGWGITEEGVSVIED